MLLNKKCIYLGVSLFSAMILGSMSNQTVKADTTSDSTNTSTVTDTQKAGSTTLTAPVTAVAPETTATTKPISTTPVSTTISLPATNATSPTSASSTATTPSSTTVTPTTRVTSITNTATVTLTNPTSVSAGTPTSTTGTTSGTSTGTTTGTTGSTSTGTTTGTTSGTTTGTAGSTSTGTTTGTTSGTTTGTTGSTSTGTTTGTTSGTSTSTTTGTATGAATTTPVSDPYALPSNLTDSSVVTFTDPTVGSLVKMALGLKSTDTVTVGDIKNYNQAALNLEEDTYSLPAGESDEIESLNGMQYLSLIPSGTNIYVQLDMASDPTANTDLMPLKNVALNSLALTADFSDPDYKEVDPTQISELNLSKCSNLEFYGDTMGTSAGGITNAQLKAMAPTLIKVSQNAQPSGNVLYLGNSSVTDFTPLKPILSNPVVPHEGYYLSAGNMNIYDPTPIYAVKGQPLTFTAEPNTGLDGEDLAATYHYSGTAPTADQVDDNITYLGNDTYVLQNADSSNNYLTYGNLGTYGSVNDTYFSKTYPNGTTFIYFGMTTQPIIWQEHPNVTIEYVDQNGDPIMNNGQPMVRTVDGVNIGDSYDLTPYSTVAGYTMTGTSSGALQGKYTQAPQVVILTYKENPAVVQPVAPTDIVNDVVDVTPQTTSPVQVYDDSGQIVPNTRVSLADTTIQESALINGKRYYMIGTDEWVPASDYDSYKPETGVVRTFGADTELVDSAGKPIDSQLSPNTEWKYNKVITIKGKKYYEVATNEYLAADSAVQFTPVKAGTAITTKIAATVYNSEGQILTTKLPAGSSWKTDGSAVINGVPMCRIATDEWIPAQGVDTYSSVKMTYTVDSETPVYDIDGNVLPNTLKAGTSWKVDQIVMIDGQEYYRVATNEYIKA